MLRLSPREVLLDDHEMAASDLFDRLLDRGLDIPTAVEQVQQTYTTVSNEFLNYLNS